MKILLVDDNSELLFIYKSLLLKKKYRVDTAQNGKEALEIAKKSPPEIIISDIMMPVMDGYTLCKYWQDDEKLRNIPFLFYTAVFTSKEDEKFALELGARKFLRKTISIDELTEEIEKILREDVHSGHIVKGKTIEEVSEFYKRYSERLHYRLSKQLYELDVTKKKLQDEQKEKQAILEAREEFENQLFSILDNWPYIAAIHSDGKILYVNKKAVEKFGANDKKDLVGQKITKFIHPDFFLSVQERLLRLVKKKETLEPTHEKLLRLDGGVIEVEISAYIFPYKGKDTFLVIAHDITEEKRKQKLLSALNEAGHSLLQALTKDEIFEIVSEKLYSFNISTVLLLADETKKNVTVEYFRFNSNKLRLLEILAGEKISEIEFNMDDIDKERKLRDGKTIFRKDLLPLLEHSLPEKYRGIAGKILQLLNIKTNITSPIFIDNEFTGLLSFQSEDLRENDIEAFSTFSNQFALAWRNLSLIEKLKREIKEKEISQRALFESEIRFRTLAEAAHIVIYLIKDTKVIYVNPYTEELLGYTLEELKEMNFWDIIHPDYVEYVKERGMARQRGEAVPERYSFPVVSKDGKIIWVDYSAGIAQIDNEIIIVGTAIDITEQRETLQKLKENEERFRTLADTTSTAIFVYSGEKFIYANKATLELTGYDENEFLKLNFWDVVHPDFKEMIRQRGLARQRGENVPARYEFKIVKKNGEERWVEFTAGKIEWEGKAASIGTAFDITSRKEK
jgi:PAS domain S-box-containing protein